MLSEVLIVHYMYPIHICPLNNEVDEVFNTDDVSKNNIGSNGINFTNET